MTKLLVDVEVVDSIAEEVGGASTRSEERGCRCTEAVDSFCWVVDEVLDWFLDCNCEEVFDEAVLDVV